LCTPDLSDEAIDGVQAAIDDLRTGIVHGYKDLCILHKKCAHVCNVPFNVGPSSRGTACEPSGRMGTTVDEKRAKT
jgi:hypothetical protein